MKIEIGDFEFTEVWDGVLYKKLSGYPEISDWEMRTIIEFIDYEKRHGRECDIVCENQDTLSAIRIGLQNPDRYRMIEKPKLITECTACPTWKGCVTEYVCHTTSLDNAIQILQCGKLLSAKRARGIPVEELMKEKRNAANDPADYFDYVMLSWGNCQAGDRLVMERSLRHFPDENNLSIGFHPGIRFYFQYENLVKHPNVEMDGVLPMKIRDELILKDWVESIVIPTELRDSIQPYIPVEISNRILYVKHEGEDIWAWSDKVYKELTQKVCGDKLR